MLRRVILMLGLACCGSLAVGQISDPYQGEYEGTFQRLGHEPMKAVANVVAEGKGTYRVLAWSYSDDGKSGQTVVDLPGTLGGQKVVIEGRSLGVNWKGDLATTETLSIRAGDIYGDAFVLKKVERQSPTLGAAPPEGAVVLLPWKEGVPPDMSEWTADDWTALPEGAMQVGKKSNVTKKKFRDYTLHVEFWVPLVAEKRGQGRGNSGVYMNEGYELQVLDSFGVPARAGDAGAVYLVKSPLVNASLPPERWQTYDIEFRAPRLDGAKLLEPARISAKLNGIVVQDNTPVEMPTGSARIKGNQERGGIMLQNHSNPVRFRNIWLVEKTD